ncbi:hypothetical protein GJ496_000918 [Pomphorhynchus laevis]|nr:hypothetical protein GJ496_000918 [Pomphorhynchus laevis]
MESQKCLFSKWIISSYCSSSNCTAVVALNTTSKMVDDSHDNKFRNKKVADEGSPAKIPPLIRIYGTEISVAELSLYPMISELVSSRISSAYSDSPPLYLGLWKIAPTSYYN